MAFSQSCVVIRERDSKLFWVSFKKPYDPKKANYSVEWEPVEEELQQISYGDTLGGVSLRNGHKARYKNKLGVWKDHPKADELGRMKYVKVYYDRNWMGDDGRPILWGLSEDNRPVRFFGRLGKVRWFEQELTQLLSSYDSVAVGLGETGKLYYYDWDDDEFQRDKDAPLLKYLDIEPFNVYERDKKGHHEYVAFERVFGLDFTDPTKYWREERLGNGKYRWSEFKLGTSESFIQMAATYRRPKWVVHTRGKKRKAEKIWWGINAKGILVMRRNKPRTKWIKVKGPDES